VEAGHTYYFQSRAQDNAGNWGTYPGGDGDTYTTIISDEKPDLTLSSGDITFSNSTPTEGAIVEITATIHNIGTEDVTSAKVKICDGAPDDGGTQIDVTQSISNISASGGTKDALVNWDTTGKAGAHTIYVVITDCNPEESNMANNKASKSITVKSKDTHGVNLIVDSPQKLTTPNQNATYVLTVTNTGTVTDSYSLTVDNINNAAVASLNRSTVTNLPSGSSATVFLNVTDETEGIYNVSVTATSQGNSSVSDTVMTETTVEGTMEYSVDLSCDNPEKSIPPKGYALYDITVKNTGNMEDTIKLEFPGKPLPPLSESSGTYSLDRKFGEEPLPPLSENWGYSLDKYNVDLSPGESTIVVLNVSDNTDEGASAGCSHEVEVTGTSQGNTSKSDSVTTRTTIGGLLPKTGDINGDSIVTIADSIYLAKHVVGLSGYETICADGDINSDGAVTIADAIYLAKHVVGLSGYEVIYP
jgi:hypothetical protein